MANLIERSGNRAWVEVDLAALQANARAVQDAAGGAPLLPMVKANAYGLGATTVARALEGLDPWGYGVASFAEGVALRESGIRRPILVLTPAGSEQLGGYRVHNLTAVIDRPAVAAEWSAPFHVEVDTGMARCGIRWDDTEAIAACATPDLEGVFTHFYAADRGVETVDEQWTRFEQALEALPRRPPLVHAQNSAGAWRLQQRLDLVRPGIFLFGASAGTGLPTPRPVASLRAPVVSVRRVRRGETVSYGGEWTAPRDTTVATLGVGYGDGIPRQAQDTASVLLGGGRRPVIGRVTMDFLMVALEQGDAVAAGDVATLVGRTASGDISLDEFAAWTGTIAYEALTRLAARLRRVYERP